MTSDAPAGPLIVPASSPNGIRLSLIVPTLNEGQNIAAFLRAVRDQLDPVARGRYEIIVMDDDSRDRTWEIAAALASEIPALKVVRRRTEKALSAAVIRGWQAAAGEILGTINADFQHPPAVLPALLEHMEQADLAIASRFAEGGGLGDWAAHRRLNSRVAHTLGRALLPRAFRRTSDPLSGCYMVRRDAIAGIELHPLGFKTLMEILVRGRIRTIRESSYEMRARKLGRSKLRARHWFDFFFHLLRLRRAAGAGSPVQ
ncbi:MAG: polyprenol monophosphomannose synthase [Candidatus Solibacter usitatus]|nr:polyprenol monophosphomannose synthase [Candidatus Solibacter usitatus]